MLTNRKDIRSIMLPRIIHVIGLVSCQAGMLFSSQADMLLPSHDRSIQRVSVDNIIMSMTSMLSCYCHSMLHVQIMADWIG